MEIEKELESKIQDEILALKNEYKTKLQKYEMFREYLDGTILKLISKIFDDRDLYKYLRKAFETKSKDRNFHIEVRNSDTFKKLKLNDFYYEMLESILNLVDSNDISRLLVEYNSLGLEQIKEIFEPLVENYIESETTADITYSNKRIMDSIQNCKSSALAILQNTIDLFSDSMILILDKLIVNNTKEKVKSQNTEENRKVDNYLEEINESVSYLTEMVKEKSLILNLDKLMSLKDKLTDTFKQSCLDNHVIETMTKFIGELEYCVHAVSKSGIQSIQTNYENMLAFENMRNDLNQVLQLDDIKKKVKSPNLRNLQEDKDILSKKKVELENELGQLPNVTLIERARKTFKDECRETRERIAELSESYDKNEKKLEKFNENSRVKIMVCDLFDKQQINKNLYDMSTTLDTKLSSLETQYEELKKKLEDESNRDLEPILRQDKLFQILEDNTNLKKELDVLTCKLQIKKTSLSIISTNDGFEYQTAETKNYSGIKKIEQELRQINREFLSYKIKYVEVLAKCAFCYKMFDVMLKNSAKAEAIYERYRDNLVRTVESKSEPEKNYSEKEFNKEFNMVEQDENIRDVLDDISTEIQKTAERMKELEEYKTEIESGSIKNSEDMIENIVNKCRYIHGSFNSLFRCQFGRGDTIEKTFNFKTHKSKLEKLKEDYRANSKDDLGILMLDIGDLKSCIHELEVSIQRIKKEMGELYELKKELDCLQIETDRLDDLIKDQINQLELYDSILKGLDVKKTFDDLQKKRSRLKTEMHSKVTQIKDLKDEIRKCEYYSKAREILDKHKNKFEEYSNKAVRIAKNYRWNQSKGEELVDKIKSVRDGLVNLVNELIYPVESENLAIRNKIQKLSEANENKKDRYDELSIANNNNKSNFTLSGSKSIQKNK